LIRYFIVRVTMSLVDKCDLFLETVAIYAALSEKKRYESCHWGGTFSKGTLLYLKGAY